MLNFLLFIRDAMRGALRLSSIMGIILIAIVAAIELPRCRDALMLLLVCWAIYIIINMSLFAYYLFAHAKEKENGK